VLRYPGAPRANRSFPTRRSSDLPPEVFGTAPGDWLSVFSPLPEGAGVPREGTPEGDPPVFAPALEEEPEEGAPWECLAAFGSLRSEEHTSELQSRFDLVCRLLLE